MPATPPASPDSTAGNIEPNDTPPVDPAATTSGTPAAPSIDDIQRSVGVTLAAAKLSLEAFLHERDAVAVKVRDARAKVDELTSTLNRFKPRAKPVRKPKPA